MEKLRLKDQTEITIQEGASLGEITAHTNGFSGVEAIGNALLKEGNLDEVIFLSDGETTGEYMEMKIERPLFHFVDVYGDEVTVMFALREKTEIEKDIEKLKAGQSVQDTAIDDLGEAVSVIAEGGEK